MLEQPLAICRRLLILLFLALFGATVGFAKPSVADTQTSRAHERHLQPRHAIRSVARTVRVHSTAFVRTALLRAKALSRRCAHPQIESRAVTPDPVQLPDFVVSRPTLIPQPLGPEMPAPPDVPINSEMTAYYAIVTSYPPPDSSARLPQLPGPALFAASHAVHSGGHPALHKLLLPVRVVELASLDTAKLMHRIFVGHAPSPDQQSAAAEETHRAIPDSTRDPCRNYVCFRFAPGSSG